MDWFQIGEGVRQGCILSPCLFNFYAEYSMWNAGLDEAQARIKTAGRNSNNLRYADDTTLMAESEEELKKLLMKVKEDTDKAGLKLNIQKTKIMASRHNISWQIDGEMMETVTDFGFSISHVWMWELAEHPRIDAWNCSVKTLEGPLDSKEIQPVKPKGEKPWILIGRTDAEAPILWPPDVKNWLTGKDPDAGKDWRQETGVTEDEMVGWHHWLNGQESEQAPGDGEGQGSLACCSPWGHKELDVTEKLNKNHQSSGLLVKTAP